MNEKQIYIKGAVLAWIIISIVISGVLILSFATDITFTGSFMPECSLKASEGKECALCGMTTAFYELSSGQIESAFRHNRGSVVLYGMFFLNSILFAIYSSVRFVPFFSKYKIRKTDIHN